MSMAMAAIRVGTLGITRLASDKLLALACFARARHTLARCLQH